MFDRPTTVLLTVLFFIVLFFVAAAVLRWVWNLTMPDIFGLTRVTYWQSFRLLVIAAILFGGIPVF